MCVCVPSPPPTTIQLHRPQKFLQKAPFPGLFFQEQTACLVHAPYAQGTAVLNGIDGAWMELVMYIPVNPLVLQIRARGQRRRRRRRTCRDLHWYSRHRPTSIRGRTNHCLTFRYIRGTMFQLLLAFLKGKGFTFLTLCSRIHRPITIPTPIGSEYSVCLLECVNNTAYNE